MKVFEKTRQEVEVKLGQMSDFLKMEYLESCLKNHMDFDVQRLCHQKLSELYDSRNMFSESAKNMSAVAELAATFKDKMAAYMKETELWIKAGLYDRAEEAFKKALASGSAREKEEMKKAIHDLYKKQALAYEKASRNSNALKIYELLLRISDEPEKLEVKKKLLELYKRLGKIREYTVLRENLDKIGA
jgi:lipopolysaccharide biosynthesis regulator YciM